VLLLPAMITSAITAAIVAVLNFLGVSPDPYLIGGIWIGVKIGIIGVMAFFGWRMVRKRKQAADAAAAAVPPPGPTAP